MTGFLWKLPVSADNVQYLLCLLGYKPNGHTDVHAYIYTLYLLAWLIDVIFGLLYEWENFIMRLSVLNDVTLLISLTFYWNVMGDLHTLLEIIKRYKKNLQGNSSFESINRRYLKNLEKIDNYVEIFLKFFIIFHIIFMSVPISTLVYNVMNAEGEIDYRRMPKLWYFHYPASLTRVTLKHYCYGNLLIYLALFVAGFLAFILMYSVSVSIYCVISSFDYLILCMIDWDQLASEITTKLHCENCSTSTQNIYELRLRYGLHEIIVFHQNLCSETCNVNKGLQRVLLIFINSCAIQMCLGFFSLSQGVDKMKYVTYVTFILIFLIFICGFGQLVKNKVDILRLTIADFAWVDKPLFYKKSLLIMLTHAAKDLEINPYGLHSLDTQTFTKIMKLLYSISNIVTHYKAKE